LAAEVIQSVVGEHLLLERLRLALARQRRGVASGDAAEIELASRAVASAVLTLDNARRRREQMMLLLSDDAPVRLDTLEEFTGPIAGLATARAALRSEAEAVVADLALTQDVLQGALRAGDAWLQALFGAADTVGPGYRPQAPTGAGGQLLNRRA
jgi:hypothetical protein